ncbi:apolipoprotein L2-like [Scyliorhinus canicula]|uniref:apolipoprotein L2-like n=1 Tax=Scyliorhinus canicula TaxID=7830 RepID=UPI0018F4B299|nr:apolipoprotein L2-like [Scyliorhinus canicula]XP_038649028.1 apolipoprotein L2-like [Scyliorhinus canicula]
MHKMSKSPNTEKVPDAEDLRDQIGLEKITQSVQDFVKRFPGWKSQIDGRIRELQEIAKSIDTFHRGSTIANVTGSSMSVVGGVLTIVGIIAAPFTAGTSLVLTATYNPTL